MRIALGNFARQVLGWQSDDPPALDVLRAASLRKRLQSCVLVGECIPRAQLTHRG